MSRDATALVDRGDLEKTDTRALAVLVLDGFTILAACLVHLLWVAAPALRRADAAKCQVGTQEEA